MVLRDLDGGHIAAVSYDSNAPIERTLRSFAVNLTGNPGFERILNQVRGERVEVALLNAAGAGVAGNLNGTIIGVEKQRQTVGASRDTVEVALLNLWCSDGLRSVKLSEVQRVRFVNAHVEREFRQALETLALSHDTQKKAVSIRFVGEGKRRVRVGYVIENPIWKTSYRLVLGQEAADKPYLQGWAVVENPTDEDWREVRMALISGRPISFQMDLYTPLYVPRPTVVPELFASLRPVTYSGNMPAPDSNSAWALGSGSVDLRRLREASEYEKGGKEGGKAGESKSEGQSAFYGRFPGKRDEKFAKALGKDLREDCGWERAWGRRPRQRGWGTSSSTWWTSRCRCPGRRARCCRSSARTFRPVG